MLLTPGEMKKLDVLCSGPSFLSSVYADGFETKHKKARAY